MVKIGALIGYEKGMDFEAKFTEYMSYNITSCQLCWWNPEDYCDELAEKIKVACEKTGMSISSLWAGWSGPQAWNFVDGPETLGLVPKAYRFDRYKEILAGCEFAAKIGIQNVITHVGFLPENMHDPDYVGTVALLRKLCAQMKEMGLNFLFETGQETPVTMLRAIEDIGLDNVGVNFDTTNLICYGKANTLDAMDIIGHKIMDMHFKDGEYPTDGRHLGKELPLGQGRANIPGVVKKLKELGYTGPLTIEREIEGPEQTKDIIMARDMLLKLWNEE